MKVKLFKIDDSPTPFEFQAQREDLQKLEGRFDFDSLQCTAQLSRKQDYIELQGQYKVQVKASCDLCLKPVELDFDESFEIGLVSDENEDQPEGDLELSLDSPEIDYFEGEEINLITYFEDQLILDIPLVVSCSEECRGLCSVCGVNRNDTDCTCNESSGNSPFAVLKDLTLDES